MPRWALQAVAIAAAALPWGMIAAILWALQEEDDRA